jgi:DNA-directed RNA polymerase specialized sigma24 family protein
VVLPPAQQAALIQRIRDNDEAAWLTLYEAYQPVARRYATFMSGRLGKPIDVLLESAQSGLLSAIGQAKSPDYKPFEQDFSVIAKREIGRAIVTEHQDPLNPVSLDKPFQGEEAGSLLDFLEASPVAEDNDSGKGEAASPVALSAHNLRQIRRALPAMSFLEELVIRLDMGLDGVSPLNDQQIAQKLCLSVTQISGYRKRALEKVSARIAHLEMPKEQRIGKPLPFKQSNLLNRLMQDRVAWEPFFDTHRKLFTQREQQVIQNLIVLGLPPDAAARQLAIPETALYRLVLSIGERIRTVMGVGELPQAAAQPAGTEPAEESPTVSEDPATRALRLAAALVQPVGLSGLTANHIRQLTWQEQTILAGRYLSRQSDAAQAEALKVSVETIAEIHDQTLDKLRTALGQRAANFRSATANPMAHMEPYLASLDPETRQVLRYYWVDGLSPRQVANRMKPLTPERVEAIIQEGKDALKEQILQPGESPLQSTASRAEVVSDEVDLETLCQRLSREGLMGLTPAMLERVTTPYQRQVLAYRSQGLVYADIARRMKVHESPVKLAAYAAERRLEQAVQEVRFLPKLKALGLTGVTQGGLDQLLPEHRKLLRLLADKDYPLKSLARQLNPEHSPREQRDHLNQLLASALDSLAPKQQAITREYLTRDVSMSQMARDHGVQLTIITQTIQAALKNVHQTLCPESLLDWLGRKGVDMGEEERVLTALTESNRKVLQLYAERDYPLEAVRYLLRGIPSPATRMARLGVAMNEALTTLKPREREILLYYCQHDYSAEAVQQAFGNKAESVLREKIGPALKKLAQSLGEASLHTKLVNRGLDFISETSLMQLPEADQHLLTALLDEGHHIAPMVARLRSQAMTEEEAFQLLQGEIRRGRAGFTDRQREILASYGAEGFDTCAAGRQLKVTSNTVRSTVTDALVKLEAILAKDSLLVLLKQQGVSALTDSQLTEMPPKVQKLLELYLEKGYSLQPALQALSAKPEGQAQLSQQPVNALVRLVDEALSSGPTELQASALRTFAETQGTYEMVAETIGIGASQSGRIGPLLSAGLENMRHVLELRPDQLS